jgi:uncharacterized protein
MEKTVDDLVPRPDYTRRVLEYVDKPLIKVIIGIRRSGKSTILRMIVDELRRRRVAASRIIFIDKESLEFEAVAGYRDLYDYVKARLPRQGRVYLFVDEVQEVVEWERAVASLLAEGRTDITVTGSNTRLLSSDLTTRLTGRYVEVPVQPLRFAEFVTFRRAAGAAGDPAQWFEQYLRYGGFPGIHYLPFRDPVVFGYLSSLYSTIVLKDVVKRHEVREPAQLDVITRFLFDNCGNVTTAKRVADFLKSQKLPVSVGRVQNYISFLEQAFLVQRCRRYDLKGRRHLELYDKYYMADVGIRHGLIGYRDGDIGGLLENVVYTELRARGYSVSVGKVGNVEVDFVAESQQERLYVQVAYLLATPQTIDREFGALEAVPDNYPKLVLSTDRLKPAERSGIRWQNLIEFLLSG